MGGPFECVKILDISAVASGPLAATLLADQGADDELCIPSGEAIAAG